MVCGSNPPLWAPRYRATAMVWHSLGLCHKIHQIHIVRVHQSRTSSKGCPKHPGYKVDPGVTPGTCGANGEKAQVILVWVRAPRVGNTSHPWGLRIMGVRPWAMRSSWRADSIMLRITSFGGVTIWVGRCPGTTPWISTGLIVAPGITKGLKRHTFLNTYPHWEKEVCTSIYIKCRWQ